MFYNFQPVLWFGIILITVDIAMRMDIPVLNPLFDAKQYLAALIPAFTLVKYGK